MSRSKQFFIQNIIDQVFGLFRASCVFCILWIDRMNNYWWLFRVTLVVAFGFCPKILTGGRDLQMIVLLKNPCSLSGRDNHRWWWHSNPTYYLKKSNFFHSQVAGTQKLWAQALALTPSKPHGKISTTWCFVFCNFAIPCLTLWCFCHKGKQYKHQSPPCNSSIYSSVTSTDCKKW